MSSSTSSSRDRRDSILLLWVFAAAFALIVAVGLILDERYPSFRLNTPFRDGMGPLPTNTLLQDTGNVFDYDAYLYDFEGTSPYMRAADVLFLGNSRGLYGFHPEGFQPRLDRYGLKGYNLSFPAGQDAFPMELIRRYDLRPKLLIINSDSFFANNLAFFGRIAVGRGYWDSWKYYWESLASWEFLKYLHAWVPPWKRYFFERPSQVSYRTIEDGGLQFRYGTPSARAMATTPPQPLTPQEERRLENFFNQQLANLRLFKQEMDARGTAMIMTVVTRSDAGYAVELTKRLSAATGVPYVEAWPLGLISHAGSHMDRASAVVYADALFDALEKNDLFLSVVGDPE